MGRIAYLRLMESFFRRWFLYPLPVLLLVASSLGLMIYSQPLIGAPT